MKEIIDTWQLIKQLKQENGHRFAVIEGNKECNRRCSYCAVPQQYKQEQEASVSETLHTVDWLHNQGYQLLSWIGGEPLAPFKTKEGITFFEHTAQVVDYASSKGMTVNVTTNGDYITEEKIKTLRQSGLDALTFSLHTYSKTALNHLVKNAKLTAKERIIPAIQTVLSSETADSLPSIATTAAENGLFFVFSIVQEKGGGFSSIDGDSIVASQEQQEQTLRVLKSLKRFGFVRNNLDYIENASAFYPNNWTCDPNRDTFIHTTADGTINICSDVRTDLHISEIPLLSESEQWRETKQNQVANCGNCLFHCYYEAQNPHLLGDVPMAGLSALIKGGQAQLVERWGQHASRRVKAIHPEVTWELPFDK